MTRRNALTSMLAAILGGLLLYWFLTSFELTEQRIYRGYRGEARTNHLLAAERFLQKMGIPAQGLESPRDLVRLPASNATLLIANQRHTLGEERSRKLLQWVARGGHLIVQVRASIDSNTPALDPILSPLGIEVGEIDSDLFEDSGTIVIDLPDSETLLEVEFTGPHWLEATQQEPLHDFGDPLGSRLLVVPHGKGYVTAMSDADWLENAAIGTLEHARLLMLLVQVQPAGGTVWLLQNDDLPPLWQWIWNHLPALVIAGFLLLIAWLTGAVRRFGPCLEDTPPRRRRIREHVEAAGYYLWKLGRSDLLLDSLRRSLQDRIDRRRPDLTRLSQEQRIEYLAEAAGIALAQVYEAMRDEQPATRQGFLRRVQTLESIRKRL